MITWIQSVIGLFFVVGGLLFLLLLLDSDGGWWFRVLAFGFAVILIGTGVWMAWPVALAVRDLFAGSSEARELVEAREAARARSVVAEYGKFRWAMKVSAVLWAGSAPFLFWVMRRGEPDQRRAWALLAAVPVGYAVLVQTGAGLLPDSALETALKEFLERNDTPFVFLLYAETLWLGTMVGAFYAGLPVGPCTTILVPIALTPYWIGYYLGYSFGKLMLCWLLAVAMGAILNGVRGLEEASERARRARKAHALERTLLAGNAGAQAFALYLRPFRTTGTLDAQQVSERADPLDLETILAAAVRPQLYLLALNRSEGDKVVGAGYLYHADAEWWPTFQRLACACRTIFVLPSTGSTLEEVIWLREHRLLEKCVFIMPETITGEALQVGVRVPTTVTEFEYRDFDHSEDWECARKALLERCGIRLPPYWPDGALFTLNAEGEVAAIAPLGLSSRFRKVRRTRNAIDAVSRTIVATA